MHPDCSAARTVFLLLYILFALFPNFRVDWLPDFLTFLYAWLLFCLATIILSNSPSNDVNVNNVATLRQ